MKEKPTYEALLGRVKQLETYEKVYRSMVDNSPDLLYRTDLEGRIVFISRSVTELSGYSYEEAIGMHMAEEIYLIPEERQAFLALLRKNGRVVNFEARLRRKDGSIWWASTNAHFYRDEEDKIAGVEGITRDISELKRAEQDRERLIAELQEAIGKVRTLSGMLPICSSCKKIRDDKGYWNQIENYISAHSKAEFSHSICPECVQALYPDFAKFKD